MRLLILATPSFSCAFFLSICFFPVLRSCLFDSVSSPFLIGNSDIPKKLAPQSRTLSYASALSSCKIGTMSADLSMFERTSFRISAKWLHSLAHIPCKNFMYKNNGSRGNCDGSGRTRDRLFGLGIWMYWKRFSTQFGSLLMELGPYRLGVI